ADWKITRGAWNALDSQPKSWTMFVSDGAVPDLKVTGKEGSVHPAGVVSAQFALTDRETKTIAFAVAWYTPKQSTLSGAEYGHRYQEGFADSSQICRYALENRLTYSTLTDEWQNVLLRSSTPPWLSRRLIND